MLRSARFSADRVYRYELWRRWDHRPAALFIGLNPSTADETEDDNTIRRCVAFAQAWGYGGLCMMNLFAYRATEPKDMLATAEPVGPDNDRRLLTYTKDAGVVVACWGTHGAHQDRDIEVMAMIPNLTYLRRTKDGFPGHPLYLPKHLTPIPLFT